MDPIDSASPGNEALRRAFVEILDLEEPVDWTALHYQATPTWDSLVHMALVSRLEADFGVTLTDEDIMALDGYDAAVRILSALTDGT